MTKIYKYPLSLYLQTQEVNLPKYHKILDIQKQDNEIVMWALVDPSLPTETITISIIGTGWTLSDDYEYLKTVQDGAYVWHFFVQSKWEPAQ